MRSRAKAVRTVVAAATRSASGVASVAIVVGTAAIGLGSSAQVAAQEVAAADDSRIEEVTVTARRKEELAQDVPIALTVIGGDALEDAGAFNTNRVKELIPTLQLYSSNPRNTGVNMRGLGSPFGLTNDGIEPGVGFYVDGVLYARPASTALDFIDVDRIEVLRGPQGTLFGKNTTAGAVLVTTRKPSRTNGASFEFGYGNDGFVQAKGSVTGPIGERGAGRLSFSGTQRDGTLYNVRSNEQVNDINNVGVRGQLLFNLSDTTDVKFTIDWTRQRPNGYAQVFAGVVPTLRPANRQFEQIIADLHYQPVSRNPFDRLIDTDTPWRSEERRRRCFRGRRFQGRAGHGHFDHLMALLGLGALERSRLPRVARDHVVAGDVEAASVEPGSPVGRRFLGARQRRVRVLRVHARDRRRSRAARAGRIGGVSFRARAECERIDARPSRRADERDLHDARHEERCSFRSDRLVDHGPAALPAGHPVQLRPEEGRLSSATCTAACRPRTRR